MVPVGEALHGGQDHPGIEFLDAGPGEAHPVQRPGAEILDHHVGILDQLLQHFLAGLGLGVQRQRALVRVEHREVERVRILDVAQLRAGHVARARPLDLDHVGAEPRQQLRAGGAGLNVGEIDDLDPVQRLAHLAFSLAR
jgi:hypothetical protein